MFQKKQLIYSETLGVCQVENIVGLSATKGGETISYYVLKPIFQQEKISYIPVEHHQVALRELFTEEEARQLLESEEAMKDELLKQAENGELFSTCERSLTASFFKRHVS